MINAVQARLNRAAQGTNQSQFRVARRNTATIVTISNTAQVRLYTLDSKFAKL